MPPVNDNFADAIDLAVDSGSLACDNTGATAETPDPINDTYEHSTTIWYKWVPSEDGFAVFSTSASGGSPIGDTVLGIYTGEDLSSLVEKAYNDDNGVNSYSTAGLFVTGGTTYYIEVAGFGGGEGTFALDWDLALITPPMGLLAVSSYNENTVTVIDTATNTVVATVAVGVNPVGVAFTRDAAFIAVANQGDSTVSIIETVGYTVIETVAVAFAPSGVAFSPDGLALVVVGEESGDGLASMIETTGWTVSEAGFLGGGRALSAAFSPTGDKVVIVDQLTDNMAVVETTGWTVESNQDTGLGPHAVAWSPDGAFVVVANNGDDSVTVFDTSDWSTVATVAVGGGPWGITVSLDSSTVVVSCQDNTFSVIETTGWTVTDSGSTGGQMRDVTYTQDGGFIALTNDISDYVSIRSSSLWDTEIAFTLVGDDPLRIAAPLGDVPPPPPTFSLTYDANSGDSGSAPVDGSSPYEEGDTVTVLDKGDLGKVDYIFNKWNTAADGSGNDYLPDDTFVMPSSDLTLYAQWIPSPVPPVEPPGEVEDSWIALEPHWMYLLDQRGSKWDEMRKVFTDGLQTVSNALYRWWLGMDMLHIPTEIDDADLRNWERMLGIPVNPVWPVNLRKTLLRIRWFKGPFTRARRNEIIELFLAAFVATSSGVPIEFGTEGMVFDDAGTAFGVELAELTGSYSVDEDIPGFSYQVNILDTYYDNGFDDTDLSRELARITPAPITFTIVSTPTP